MCNHVYVSRTLIILFIYNMCSTFLVNNTRTIASLKAIQKIINIDNIKYTPCTRHINILGPILDENIT